MYPQSLPMEKVGRAIKEDGGYLDDAILKLSSDGEILFEKSARFGNRNYRGRRYQ